MLQKDTDNMIYIITKTLYVSNKTQYAKTKNYRQNHKKVVIVIIIIIIITQRRRNSHSPSQKFKRSAGFSFSKSETF